MHLDKFGFGNGISRILTSLLDKMCMANKIVHVYNSTVSRDKIS